MYSYINVSSVSEFNYVYLIALCHAMSGHIKLNYNKYDDIKGNST